MTQSSKAPEPVSHKPTLGDPTPRPKKTDTPVCLYTVLAAIGMMMAGSVAVTAVV